MTETSNSSDPLRAEFLHLVETAAEPWQPADNMLVISPAEEEPAPVKKEGRGAARLISMLEACPLFIDPRGKTYIQLEGDVCQLNSKDPRFLEIVSDIYYQATGEPMGKDALSAVVPILSRRARLQEDQVPMANRAAVLGNSLFFDLGNRRAARITGGTWTIVDSRPGMFRNGQHKVPYPDPITPGNAWKLFDFVNIQPAQQLFVLATLVALMVPGIVRPGLLINGPQGSGKSTFARLIKWLLDHSNPLLTMIPRKVEDFDLLLGLNAILTVDNLSGLLAEIADTICAITTGAAPQRRKNYTDDEILTLYADVALIFTGINSLSDRPDFMERILRIPLERIEDIDRQGEDELDTAFQAALPSILGGFLTMLAQGLELQPSYRPERLPRMATYSRLAAAIAEATEAGAGERYLAEFTRNQGAQQLELADGNLLFGAILESCSNGHYPEGTFNQVVSRLKELANPGPKDPFPTARGFRKALERLRVPLRTAGIEYVFDETRTAAGKASVRFFTREDTKQLTEKVPIPPEPAELMPDGLVFDPGELDL